MGKMDARNRTAPNSKEREFQVEKKGEVYSLQVMALGIVSLTCSAPCSVASGASIVACPSMPFAIAPKGCIANGGFGVSPDEGRVDNGGAGGRSYGPAGSRKRAILGTPSLFLPPEIF